MTSVMQILRRIGAPKAPPASGTAGELALWKAGTTVADALALYFHDGVQFVPIVDTDANLTLLKPGAGAAGRYPVADAVGSVSWAALVAAAPTITITGATSLTGGGDLTANRTLSLVGDVAAPGNSFYYGTNATGVKGFYTLPTGNLGDVVGPASSTDNALARFDGATGKLIQNSTAILDDTGNLSGVVNLTTTGDTILGSATTNTLTVRGTAMSVPNNLDIDGGTLFIDAANNEVGFGTTTPASRVDVNGVAAHNVATTTGAMDLAVSQMFTATVAGATGWSFTNVPASRGVTVVLHLTNGGSGAQTWPTSIKWPSGVAPTLTVVGTDVLVFVTHDGGATWRGNVFGSDIK